MIGPAGLAFFGAAGIAMASALFGVGIARMVWADDLKAIDAAVLDEREACAQRAKSAIGYDKNADIIIAAIRKAPQETKTCPHGMPNWRLCSECNGY